jgi:predicted short-subunit dehydrogenase-like oxidoreductase (DUF2520 family)
LTRVGLVGPGRVGRSITSSLPAGSFRLGPIISHSLHSARRAARELGEGFPTDNWAALEECDVAIVSVPDDSSHQVIRDIYERCNPIRLPCVLYTGRTLRVADQDRPRFGRFYPLRVFQRQLEVSSGMSFAICGGRVVLSVARAITTALGGRALVVAPERLEQIVVGATIASDAITGLLELAVQRVVAAGAPRGRAVDAIRCLVDSSLDDYSRSGSKSRPGPMLEGQSKTVQSLLNACREDDPAAGELYRAALQLSLDALGKQNDSFHFLSATSTALRPAIRAAESNGVVISAENRHQLRNSG